MKQVKTWLATIAMLLCSISASAYDFEVNGIYYNILSAEDKTVEVTYANSFGSYTGSVTIPNSVISDGVTYSVTSIGNDAFYGCSDLVSINISEGVISIGEYAFYGCSNLASINIPEGVIGIDRYAFFGCSNLTSVYIPESVINIANTVFAHCYSLTSINIPEGVTSISAGVFAQCKKLTSIEIPNGVTSIGMEAFFGCSNLTSINIPEGVINMGDGVFKNCSAFPVINGIRYADTYLVEAVDKTQTTYTIKDGTKFIGDEAFANCVNLTSIDIPEGVIKIGAHAFGICSKLSSVNIPESVVSVGFEAFVRCYGLPVISNIIYADTYLVEVNDKSQTSYTIKEGTKFIGDHAFNHCRYMTSIDIPEGVTSIGVEAFYYCENLISANIPESVTSIGVEAFYYCKNLISANIPESVTSIAESTFYGCQSLTSVLIPNSVTSIGDCAFCECPKLLNVYCYAENVPSAYSYVFASSYPENATLHVPVASLESYKSTSPWSSFGNIVALPQEITLEDGVEYENNTEADMPQITYTRTLPNLQWNALFVPFEIPVSELANDYDVAYINDIHSYDKDLNGEIDQMEMEVIYIKEGTLHANHPYLIRAKSNEAKSMNIVVTDARLYSSAKANRTSITCSSAYTDFEVVGTYEKMTAQELDGCYAINTSGAWSPIASGASLNPFRLYMTITSRNGSPVKVSQSAMSRINIRVQGEDTETGIGEIVDKDAKAEIYDMTGRRLQNAHKGIYIINGKKVIK